MTRTTTTTTTTAAAEDAGGSVPAVPAVPAPRMPTRLRLTDRDPDYRRLYAATVRRVDAALDRLVAELRAANTPGSISHDAAGGEAAAQSRFIAEATAALREGYLAAYRAGIHDYYGEVSATPGQWTPAVGSDEAMPDTATFNKRMAYYAVSVAKMAHEAAQAARVAALKTSGAVTTTVAALNEPRDSDAYTFGLPGGGQPKGYNSQPRDAKGHFLEGRGRQPVEQHQHEASTRGDGTGQGADVHVAALHARMIETRAAARAAFHRLAKARTPLEHARAVAERDEFERVRDVAADEWRRAVRPIQVRTREEQSQRVRDLFEQRSRQYEAEKAVARAAASRGEREIIVHFETTDARAHLHALFGRELAGSEVASLVGAQHGDHVIVAESGTPHAVLLHLRGPGYNLLLPSDEAAAYVADRTLSRNERGTLILRNDLFVVREEFRGQHVGTRVFRDQVRGASALGVRYIETLAVREKGAYNGYYTWPRLGYNAALRLTTAQRRSLPPALRQVKTLQQLMRSDDGVAWWKKHGVTSDMRFNLWDGSVSRRALDGYLEKRGLTHG